MSTGQDLQEKSINDVVLQLESNTPVSTPTCTLVHLHPDPFQGNPHPPKGNISQKALIT